MKIKLLKRRAILLSVIISALILVASLAFFALNVFKGKKAFNNSLSTGDTNMAVNKIDENDRNNIKDYNNEQISEKNDVDTKNVEVGGVAKKAKVSSNDFNKCGEENKYASQWNRTCDWNMILLNDENSIPKGLVPPLKDYGGVKVNSNILPHLDSMIKAAKKDGINLWVSSCYRSVDYQETLYNRKVKFYLDKGYKKQEAEKLARKVVAYPGTSEHNLGLAVDFNGVKDDFYMTKEFAWLKKHGTSYGFILRYEKDKQNITNKIYEPWHFRYVGKDAAQEIEQHGFCLEEYIQFLIKARK